MPAPEADALTPHPWSRGFDWAGVLPDGPLRTLTTDQREQFDRDGYLVIDRLIDDRALAAITADIDPQMAAVDELLAGLPDERLYIAERGALTFNLNLALRSALLLEFVRSEPMVSLVHDLVGADARLYHDQAVYKWPEKPRHLPWHQDNGYAFVEPEAYLTIWVALTEATLDNGCVWAAPGLHQHGTLEHHFVDPLGWQVFEEPPVPPVAAPVPAGGAVVFSSLTPHLTGANTSDAVRKAYIVQYMPDGALLYERGPSAPLLMEDDERYPWVLREGRAVT